MPRAFFWPSLCLALFVALFAAPLAAQAPPAPTLEVRAASVNQFLAAAQYLGEVFDQGEPAKQGVEFLNSQIDEKTGLEGIDTARPWGLYATVTKDVIDSPVILMVPLADAETFLGLLRDRLNLQPKKLAGGTYEVRVPNFPLPVFFRFADKHVLVTISDAKNLDAAKVIPAKDFFAKEQASLLTAAFHFDRIPADVKKVVFGQWELQANDGMRRVRPGETAAQTKLRTWLLEQTLPGIQAVLNEAEALSLRIDVNAEDAAAVPAGLAAGIDFTARQGTPLAKILKGLQGRKGLALAAGERPALASFGGKLGLPDEARKTFPPVIDALLDEAITTAAKDQQIPLKLFLDAARPTLRAGELDLQAAAYETGTPGKMALVLALKTVQGAEFEKLAKFVAGIVPDKDAHFDFDRKTVNGVKLHCVTLKSPELEKLFGTQTVHLGTSEGRLIVAFESDAALLGTAAGAAVGETSPLAGKLNIPGLMQVAEKELSMDKLQEIRQLVYGDKSRSGDAVTFSVKGGERLSVSLAVPGKALKFLTLIDAEKKKGK